LIDLNPQDKVLLHRLFTLVKDRQQIPFYHAKGKTWTFPRERQDFSSSADKLFKAGYVCNYIYGARTGLRLTIEGYEFAKQVLGKSEVG